MILLVTAALLLCFSAFVAGAETALFHLSPAQRDKLRDEGDPASARVLALLAVPRHLVLTLLICNEAANLLFAAAVALWIATTRGPDALWWALLIVVPIILLLAETLPKSLALRHAPAFARRAAPAITFLSEALSPLRWVLLEAGTLLLKPAGTGPWSLPNQIEEEDIKHFIDLGEQAGTIAKDERDLIHNVFALGDTVVSKLMTPRTEMIAFPVNTPVDQLLERIRDQRFARVPIYKDSPDNIIGILYTKDLLSLTVIEKLGPRRPSRRSLTELLRQPRFVPVTRKADELFRDFQSSGAHMAIVVDEYGGVAGLVTIDDLLGELFGEMLDELDAEEPAAVRDLGDGAWEVQGHVQLVDFNEATGATLSDDADYTTVGGYVLVHLGHLPEPGEAVEADGWRFVVVSVAESRVQTLRVTRLPDEDGEAP